MPSESVDFAAGVELSAGNAAFSKLAPYTGSLIATAAGRLRSSAGNTAGLASCVYTHSTPPVGTDCSVSIDIVLQSTINSGTKMVGVALSADPANSAHYFVYASSAGVIGIRRHFGPGASDFTQGPTIANTVAAGATVNIRAQRVGGTIYIYKDGAATPLFTTPYTDGSPLPAGRAGIRYSDVGTPTDTTGWHIDNWSLDDPAAGTSPVTTPVALATEADTALALAPVGRRPVDLATESDTALQLPAVGIRPLSLAVETDSALALPAVTIAASATPAALATETDSALALTAVGIRPVSLAVEADTALALPAVAVIIAGAPVGLAVETDTAIALPAVGIRAVALAVEADTALALPAPAGSAPQPLTLIARAVAAAVAALEAAPPVAEVVDRVRLRPWGQDVMTAIDVRPMRAAPQSADMAGRPVAWESGITVRCCARAPEGVTPDAAVDAVLGPAYARLMADPTLGGVVLGLTPIGIEFDFDGSAADDVASATLFIQVRQRATSATLH